MSSQGIELRDMSSQGIELREKTQQAKSEKDHEVVIDPKPRKLRGLSHRRSFATTFTQNLLREIDRNIYKEVGQPISSLQ
jgi:hypothetical protein